MSRKRKFNDMNINKIEECKMKQCRYRTTHTTAQHKCHKCNGNHSMLDCNSYNKTNYLPNLIYSNGDASNLMTNNLIKDILNTLADTKGKIYTERYAGMGNMLYIKRDNVDMPLNIFFLDNNNCGQYGPETNDLPKLEAFLKTYKKV
jgi:hypothetical protein